MVCTWCMTVSIPISRSRVAAPGKSVQLLDTHGSEDQPDVAEPTNQICWSDKSEAASSEWLHHRHWKHRNSARGWTCDICHSHQHLALSPVAQNGQASVELSEARSVDRRARSMPGLLYNEPILHSPVAGAGLPQVLTRDLDGTHSISGHQTSFPLGKGQTIACEGQEHKLRSSQTLSSAANCYL